MRHLRVFALSALTAVLCLALAPAAWAADEALYRELLGDVLTEARQFAQDKQIPDAELQRFESSWKALMAGTSNEMPSFEGNLPWQGIWPPKAAPNASANEGEAAKLKAISRPEGAHSIGELDRYLSDRVGGKIYEAAKAGVVDVLVYAGEGDSFSSHVSKTYGNARMRRIPSLYESWGIEKFLISRSGGRPVVGFKIPPIMQYAKHYQAMFALISDGTAVVVNERDRERMRFDYRKKVGELWRQLDASPKRVVLGYSYRWPDVIRDMGDSWQEAAPSRRVTTSDKSVSGTLFKLGSKIEPGKTVDFLALESDLTLWGEATSFLLDAVGRQNGVEALYFLGSAGAPSELGKVYDVSIPQEFNVDGEKIRIVNALNETAALDKILAKSPSPVDVLTTAKHAHTNSPAEQTLAYTSGEVAKGINTIDVEQALLAQTIAKLNAAGKNIRFGAANILTDKPKTAEGGPESEHDLSQVDPKLKDMARRKILSLVLQDFQRRDLGIPMGGVCDKMRAASGF